MIPIDPSRPRPKAGFLHILGINAALMLALIANVVCKITTVYDFRKQLAVAGAGAIASLLLLVLIWRGLGAVARAFSLFIALLDLLVLLQVAGGIR